MPIFFPPPPVFTGGAQPYGKLKAVIPSTDNPPFTYGGPYALNAELISLAQPSWLMPTLPSHTVFTNPADNPPFKYGGPYAVNASIIADAQPNLWTYTFMGGLQPYTNVTLPPVLAGVQINNPPFTYGGPYALKAEGVAIAQPDPWTYNFTGNSQPYMGRQLPANLLDVPVNNPPFTYGGPIVGLMVPVEIAQPPWPYTFIGGGQPYQPTLLSPAYTNVVVNNPPFTYGGPIAPNAVVVSDAQPNPWTYTFMGGPQPFAPALLPGSTFNIVDNPPFNRRRRMQVDVLISFAWIPYWDPTQPRAHQSTSGPVSTAGGFYRAYIYY